MMGSTSIALLYRGEPEKEESRCFEARYIALPQTPYALIDLASWNRRNLIDHEM